ncbi:LysR family transcriptional regulator [Nocardiopsis dassonvillei]|uniref:Transcriptional regulator, LysR family n=1 Tax=Nocardiopsis dassonvillei (strain ATCC 23218 / DSM 43111 / CIP 107115 / JCM 7437 / KCTC 9190 / NBRC 14626 / NCTC 10488 / NRRL B-5397 / IMRU 509) TaxID=446468 RepID=D7B5F9_NOCDD|nr:LysR family transcriptional regulator [Nocardiopsis dassonvillei]ADH67226.1 transcriptional regulator, LysR family [Nocardiopsis dassonvillei subsp. dassonvillei DSM 43111]NKY78827.1 LysR family transcriptional regulator [Nocardiopsis dassonvillei]VEI87284.1 Cyn operon transcriptional activator [Nocardiopsis dassonvillei]
MDARQLSYFLAIVDHGGFGRAAEHLHIAQPSLSQAIGGLERELGVDLFHRVGRGVVLTDTGTRLIEPARQVVRDLEAVRDTARSARGLRRGRVDLVSTPSPGIEPLTTLMASFAREYPLMTVNVAGAFTPEEVVQHVRSGAAEIGLLGSAGHPRTADLRVLPVEEQPLVLLSPPEEEGAPPERTVSGGTGPVPDRIDRADLGGLRLIASQRGSLMRQIVDDILAGGTDAHLAAEVDHRTSILPLVLSGLGHAVMPSSWKPIATRMGARVRLIEPVSRLRVVIVSRASRMTPAAQAFLGVAEHYARTRPEAEPGGSAQA